MRRNFGSGGRFRPQRIGRLPRSYGGALVYCQKRGEEIPVGRCESCPEFGVWHAEDLARCRFEFEGLRSRGHYAETQEEWMEYLKDLDPATYRELREERENRERVLGEMEEERRAEEGMRARQGDVPGGGREGCRRGDSGGQRAHDEEKAGGGRAGGDDDGGAGDEGSERDGDEEEDEEEEEEEDEPEEEGW